MKTPTDRYELHMELMHDAVLQQFSRRIERAARLSQNGYRRRLYFEGMARLGEDIALLASAAANLVRLAGKDIENGP